MAHPEISKRLFDKDVAALTEEAAKSLRFAVNSKEFPTLDVTVEHSKPIRLRFQCEDWDDQPPSIELLNPDGTAYDGTMPSNNVFNGAAHPKTGRRFVCMRGSREYHTHPSHVNESWGAYRGQDGMNVCGILMQLARSWRKGIA